MEMSQIVPAINNYGAISHFVLELQKIITHMGYSSWIYSEHIGQGLPSFVRKFTEYEDKRENILILHGSIRSKVNAFFKNQQAKKLLVYYSPTPAYFFENTPEFQAILAEAEKEFQQLVPYVDASCGISPFCQQELKTLGFKNPQVLPVITNLKRFQNYDKKIYQHFKDGRKNILFVGRIVPHKKIEDLIRIFYYYKKFIDAHARLLIIGPKNEFPPYDHALVHYLDKLDLDDVHFSGEIKDEELGAYYRVADVFLGMSAHEGFCVPLVESMYFKIPIIAYAAAAVPFTLADAGVLVRKKDPKVIAEMIQLLLTHTTLREKIVQEQQKVYAKYAIPKIVRTFQHIITPLLPK